MTTEATLRRKWNQVRGSLDERGRREWAAAEALAIGYGGLVRVHRATGMARSTIRKGIKELEGLTETPSPDEPRRVRRPGGGRKKKTEEDPGLLDDLEALVEPGTRGDPESPLRWTVKSLRTLARELKALGHSLSYRTVGRLLKTLGYSLQGNRKTLEGTSHPDRDAQFEYINQKTAEQSANGEPSISVDTKKKELVGPYKNVGKALRPKGEPEKVNGHDFRGELGRANPYGVYDIERNEGWVSVGISSDTAEFAVESIRRWWNEMGRLRYPDATSLLTTADCGGSNGYRTRLWKLELQRLADDLGLAVTVCHLPPGTSKWNKIEHRLFSFIAMNWRGRPLVDYQTIVQLIAATTTEAGLQVRCALDENEYEKGRKVSDAEMAALNLHRHEFHGDWNYTLTPSQELRP
jgi:transposase